MSDKVFLGQRVSKLDIGNPSEKITCVRLLVDSEHEYVSGDSKSGRTIEKTCPWGTQSMCDSILAAVSGIKYLPFSVESGLIDPAAETGDGITVGRIYSVLANSDIRFNGIYSANISAPSGNEVEDEYPYKSKSRREAERQQAITRSSITKTSNEINLKVEGMEESIAGAHRDVANLAISVGEISSTVQGQNNEISSIKQSVNNISLSVSGSLGGTASITISSGGSKSGSIDLSNVRTAFRDDNTAINISAGKVTFEAGLFAVNGETFTIDSNSVSSIGGEYKTSISNGSFSIYSTYLDGNTRINNFIGKIGATYWSGSRLGAKGIMFGIDSTKYGDFMSWGVRETENSNDYNVKLIYPHKHSLSANGSGSFESECFYIDTYFRTRFGMELCQTDDLSSVNGSIVGIDDGGLDLYCIGDDEGLSQIRFSYSPNANLLNGTSILRLYKESIDCDTDIYMNNHNIYGESDERLKTNIKESELSAISAINRMKTYSYKWIESGDEVELGFIAQQLEQDVSPDFVHVDKTSGLYSICEMKMIPYLVKAVQEICERLDSLDGGIATAALMSFGQSWEPGNYTEEEKIEYVLKSKEKRTIKERNKPAPVTIPA